MFIHLTPGFLFFSFKIKQGSSIYTVTIHMDAVNLLPLFSYLPLELWSAIVYTARE